MRFGIRILLILIVLPVSAARAQVWESLAEATQMFTEACPKNLAPPADPLPEEARTEASVAGYCRDCEMRIDPAGALAKHSELIADDTYLAALARERSLNHDCGIKQLDKALGGDFDFYSKDIQSKLEALSRAILDHVRTSEKNQRIPKRDIVKRQAQIAKVYQEQTAAIAAIQNSIPFGSHPVMQKFISRTVQESLREATTIGGLANEKLGPKPPGPDFASGLRGTLIDVRAHLKKDVANLESGVSTLGASLDRETRESLAQDRDLVESFVQRNPKLKGTIQGTACRVDRTYGRGAEARDQALFYGSIGLTVGSGVLGLAARGATLLAATTSVRMASARGLLTANAARVLGGLAVHTGRTALAVATTAGFQETASACLNNRQIVPATTAGTAPRCESYSVKAIVADNCYLAAGLTALGTVANVPAVQRFAGRLVGAFTPAGRAELALGRSLSQTQKDAIQEAHMIGLGEVGRNGKAAGIGNYTDQQLKAKAEVLRRAGFGVNERRKLMESGAVGLRAGELPPGLNSPYVSFAAADGNRYAGRFLGADDGGYILETANGARHRVTAGQLGSFKESSTARLAFERVDNPSVNGFRDNLLAGNFSGDRRFISVQTATGRLPGRILEADNTGSLKVEILDPQTGRREIRVLTKEELLSARQSESAKTSFGQSRESPTVVVQNRFGNQPGRSMSDQDILNSYSARTYVDEAGTRVQFNTATPSAARNTAVREGRLIEMRPSQAQRLEPGSYTYVITRDGTLAVGRVEDSFEYGVKHGALARGRELVSAGELRVLPDGSYHYNLESGSFVRPLIEERGVNFERLTENTGRTLEDFMKSPGKRTDEILLPRQPPSRQRLMQMCSEAAFCLPNASSCRQLFGPQYCQ